MNEIKFPYKPNVIVFTLSFLVLFGLTIGLGYMAIANTQGLILNRILEFSVEGATIFYWSLTVACGLLTFIVVITVFGALTVKKEIIVSGNNIIAPKSGISKKIITINLNEVTDVNIQSVQKLKILNIVHPNNKLAIPSSMLPNMQLFDELTALIVSKANG